jgi:prevent-host-death family protein
MTKTRSVAAARQEFTSLLDGVERGNDVVVTRRGKPVGVLISYSAYVASSATRFGALLERLRSEPPMHLDGTEFENLRDVSAGRG